MGSEDEQLQPPTTVSRIVRALAFAICSVGAGVAGHALMSGQPLDVRLLLVGLPVAAVFTWLTDSRRRSARSLALLVTAAQALVHAAGLLVGQPTASTSHGHAHHVVATHAGPSLAMLALHVVATAIGIFIVLRLERHAWRAARSFARCAVRWIMPGRSKQQRRTAAPAVALRQSNVLRKLATEWIATGRPLRGPPVAARA